MVCGLVPVYANLTDAVNNILDTQASNMQVGVYIKNLTTGKVLYSQDGQRPMTPASNAKVFTSAAAYLYLGPNYHFTTEIDSLAPVAPTLKGNVYYTLAAIRL